jgi:hypothetical protein
MSYTDNTFNRGNVTVYYRIYAINNGVYGNHVEFSQAINYKAPDPENTYVASMGEAILVGWEAPDTRLVGGYEVKHHATSGIPSESSATTVYSGNNTTYFYAVKPEEIGLNHQFYITTLTK